MAELLQYDLGQGTSIASGFDPASPRDHAARAAETLAAAVGPGRRAAEVAFEQFQRMATMPDEITMEIGLKLSGRAGAVLAETASEGHVVLELVWRPTSA